MRAYHYKEERPANYPIVEIEILDEKLSDVINNLRFNDFNVKTFDIEMPEKTKLIIRGEDAVKACNELATKLIEMKELNQESATQFINNLLDTVVSTKIANLRQGAIAENKLLNDLQAIISELKPVTTPNSLSLRMLPKDEEYGAGFALSTFHRCPPNIKDIVLISAQQFDEYNDDDHQYSYLRITDDKDNITYFKIENENQLGKLRDLASLLGTREDPVAEIGPSENWKKAGIKGVYGGDTHALYARLHKKIAREIDTYLRMHMKDEIENHLRLNRQEGTAQNPTEYRGVEGGVEDKKGQEMVGESTKLSTSDADRFAHVIQNPKVRIVELGCGHAKALYQAVLATEALLGKGNVDYLGGDYSDVNIEAAKKYWAEHRGKGFFPEKIKVMNSVSPECEQELKKRPEGCIDLVICSGHITRIVLNTVHEGLKVLHNLHRSGVSCIFASGCREALYSKNILAKAGFQSVINFTPIQEEVDLIEVAPVYPPAQKFLDDYNNGLNPKYLDLSMCPDPVKVLTELKDSPALALVECLDLSYCELSKCDMKVLSELLKNFTNLKELIFVSPYLDEVTFMNQHKNDLISPTFRETAGIQINTLLNKDERLAVLPYDMYQMLNQKQLLKILKEGNPELKEVPAFYLRKDYFKPSIPLVAEQTDVEEKKKTQQGTSDFLSKTDLAKLRMFQHVDSSSHPLSLADDKIGKDKKARK